MSYYRQFDHFHPLKRIPAAVPLPVLRDIAQRARKILPKDTTVKQAIAIAETVDWMVDHAIKNASESAEENGETPPERRDRSDSQWLSEQIFLYDESQDPKSYFPGYHQCFAVLALWKVADAHFCIDSESRNGALKGMPITEQWMAAANYGIDAMEAVCLAEALHNNFLGEKLAKILKVSEPSTEDLVREKISLVAQRAAIKSHAGNHAARARALELYHTHKYPSVAAASQVIAPLVFKTTRTVERWLYDERKGRTPKLPGSTGQ